LQAHGNNRRQSIGESAGENQNQPKTSSSSGGIRRPNENIPPASGKAGKAPASNSASSSTGPSRTTIPSKDIDVGDDEMIAGLDESAVYPYGEVDTLGSTELIQRTVDLLSAHRLSIAEMVEVMKDEMELVQNMENAEDRDAEVYIDRLERILDVKAEAISTLMTELDNFKRFASDDAGTKPIR
jgi:hypothetical protein